MKFTITLYSDPVLDDSKPQRLIDYPGHHSFECLNSPFPLGMSINQYHDTATKVSTSWDSAAPSSYFNAISMAEIGLNFSMPIGDIEADSMVSLLNAYLPNVTKNLNLSYITNSVTNQYIINLDPNTKYDVESSGNLIGIISNYSGMVSDWPVQLGLNVNVIALEPIENGANTNLINYYFDDNVFSNKTVQSAGIPWSTGIGYYNSLTGQNLPDPSKPFFIVDFTFATSIIFNVIETGWQEVGTFNPGYRYAMQTLAAGNTYGYLFAGQYPLDNPPEPTVENSASFSFPQNVPSGTDPTTFKNWSMAPLKTRIPFQNYGFPISVPFKGK